MNRIGLTFTALVVSPIVIIAGGLVGPPPALAVDNCPHPELTQAKPTPRSLIGGNDNFDVILTFAANIPQGCSHSCSFTLDNNQAAGANHLVSFVGNGTNKTTHVVFSKVVDQTQNVMLTYQALSGEFAGGTVGGQLP